MPENETVTEASPETEGATPVVEELGEKGVAALKAEREARKAAEKASTDMAARLKEFEDRDKSEAQKQQEALEAARTELAELTVAKTRAEVAATKGVPSELIAGPASTSAEDVAAFADALIAFKGAQPAETGSFIIASEGGAPQLALNGDGIEQALRSALGIA